MWWSGRSIESSGGWKVLQHTQLPKTHGWPWHLLWSHCLTNLGPWGLGPQSSLCWNFSLVWTSSATWPTIEKTANGQKYERQQIEVPFDSPVTSYDTHDDLTAAELPTNSTWPFQEPLPSNGDGSAEVTTDPESWATNSYEKLKRLNSWFLLSIGHPEKKRSLSMRQIRMLH